MIRRPRCSQINQALYLTVLNMESPDPHIILKSHCSGIATIKGSESLGSVVPYCESAKKMQLIYSTEVKWQFILQYIGTYWRIVAFGGVMTFEHIIPLLLVFVQLCSLWKITRGMSFHSLSHPSVPILGAVGMDWWIVIIQQFLFFFHFPYLTSECLNMVRMRDKVFILYPIPSVPILGGGDGREEQIVNLNWSHRRLAGVKVTFTRVQCAKWWCWVSLEVCWLQYHVEHFSCVGGPINIEPFRTYLQSDQTKSCECCI